MTNILFWYTGAAIWLLIASALALAAAIGIIVAGFATYYWSRTWTALQILARVPHGEERKRIARASSVASASCGNPFNNYERARNWANAFCKAYNTEVNEELEDAP